MITKPIIRHLTKITDSPKQLENALICTFAQQHKLSLSKLPFLCKDFCIHDSKSYALVAAYLHSQALQLTITDLITIFDQLIPAATKKSFGAVYTPHPICNYIVKEGLKKRTSPPVALDPSCGCGAFLLEYAEQTHKKFGISFAEIAQKYIYGVDVDTNALSQAAKLLALQALLHGEIVPKFKLKCADFLNPETITWLKQESGGFDAVIGNPPYVRTNNMTDTMKASMAHWSVDGDFYMSFFEAGISTLKENGSLAYITSNSYLQNKNGKKLKKFFASQNGEMRVLNFGTSQLFDSAMTYVAITFFNKNTKKSLLKYADVDSVEKLKKPNYCTHQLAAIIGDNSWQLSANVSAKISKIEATGKPLSSWLIRNGIATLRDNIFIFKPIGEDDDYYWREWNGKEYKIEKGVCVPIVRNNNLKIDADVERYKEVAIYPYRISNKKDVILQEDEFVWKYENAYEFLFECKHELDMRDKGRREYAAWYAYGRTQGLLGFGKKLLLPAIVSTPVAVMCNDENCLFYGGVAIFSQKSGEDAELELRWLQKILLSDVFKWYVQMTSKRYSGGYYALAKGFIQNFGVVDCGRDEIEWLVRENDNEKVDAFLLERYGVPISF